MSVLTVFIKKNILFDNFINSRINIDKKILMLMVLSLIIIMDTVRDIETVHIMKWCLQY